MLLPRVEPDYVSLARFSTGAEIMAAAAARKAKFATFRAPVVAPVRRSQATLASSAVHYPKAFGPVNKVRIVECDKFNSQFQIRVEIAKQFGMEPCYLLRKRGPFNLRRVRMIAVAACRSFLGLSLPRVGKVFGLDHTSVLNATKALEPVMNYVVSQLPIGSVSAQVQLLCDICQFVDRKRTGPIWELGLDRYLASKELEHVVR